MRVQVVYTTHCKEAKLLAEDMARYARTYAKPMTDYLENILEMLHCLICSV